MSTSKLGTLVDTVIAEVLALAPGADVSRLHAALGAFAEELISAASVQSAGATLGVLGQVEARLAALERERGA